MKIVSRFKHFWQLIWMSIQKIILLELILSKNLQTVDSCPQNSTTEGMLKCEIISYGNSCMFDWKSFRATGTTKQENVLIWLNVYNNEAK